MIPPVPAVLTGLCWIDLANLSASDIRHIKLHYSYPHPSDENTVFETFIILDDRIGVPYGNIDKLYSLVSSLEVEDRTIAPTFDTPVTAKGLTLRPYQQIAMDEIFSAFSSGTYTLNLSGPCGSGKSFVLAAILAKLGVKTLVIAHMTMLIDQIKDEISAATGMTVTRLDKDNDVVGDINVATSQFISHRPALWKEIKHKIGLIVVDEAESSASITTLRILQRAHARYRIFISATYSRSTDGRTGALRDLSGLTSVLLKPEVSILPRIILVECPEVFLSPASKFMFAKAKGTFFERKSIEDKVIKIVEASLKKGRYCLVACDINKLQVRLADRLNNMGINAEPVSSAVPMDKRLKIIKEFNDGNVKVLLGFGTLVAGLSIPRIATIIRVSTPNNPEKMEQLVGRAQRAFKGKDEAYIIDLVFNGFNLSRRYKLYTQKSRSSGWKVFRTNWDAFEKNL